MKCAQILLFVIIFLIVLNPYTIWGKPGILAALLAAVYSIYVGLNVNWVKKVIFPLGIILLISMWGALVSEINGIGQMNHPSSICSLIVMFLAGSGIWAYCQKRGIAYESVLMCILLVIVANCAVILLEVNYPEFRALVESVLVEAGNIDFSEGFRLRGLSASGGAGLSVTLPIAMLIALHLFHKREIGLFLLFGCISILLSSGLVIGRTGLVLMPVAAAFYVLLNHKRFLSFRGSLYLTVIALIVVVTAPIFYDYVSGYFTEKFGEGFMNYAFNFVLKGPEGFRDEGTVSMIGEFLSVLPVDFPAVVTGYGFYGGSDFVPWSDSGFARTFLSVGFPLGILFYVCVLTLFTHGYGNEKYLLWPILFTLLIAEAKEPLLFSGNASRMFLLILIFSQLSNRAGLEHFTDHRRP